MQVHPPTLSEIKSVSDQVISLFPKAKTILFGSYARGNPRPDSDVDLLVVTPFSKNPAKVALELCDTIKPRFAVDFILPLIFVRSLSLE